MRPLGECNILKAAGEKSVDFLKSATPENNLWTWTELCKKKECVCVPVCVCVCVSYLGTAVRITSGTRLKLTNPELFFFGVWG